MGFWINFLNFLILVYICIVWTNNSNIIMFFIWTETLWILMYALTITLASGNNSLILPNTLFLLTCTVLEIGFTSLIYLNIFTKN